MVGPMASFEIDSIAACQIIHNILTLSEFGKVDPEQSQRRQQATKVLSIISILATCELCKIGPLESHKASHVSDPE